MGGKPRVIIPETSDSFKFNSFKFIQLYINDEPNIIEPPYSYKPYFRGSINKKHREILKDTLNEFELKFEFIGNQKPNKIGRHYYVTGMGSAVTSENHLAIFKDNRSIDYGIGFDRRHFNEIKQYFPKGIKVVVE